MEAVNPLFRHPRAGDEARKVSSLALSDNFTPLALVFHTITRPTGLWPDFILLSNLC